MLWVAIGVGVVIAGLVLVGLALVAALTDDDHKGE